MRHAVDTGPLVALLDRRDAHHLAVRAMLDELHPPIATCEAVVTEAMHLLRHHAVGRAALLTLFGRGLLSIGFRFEPHLDAIQTLLGRYADVPMSFADACLVRMSEVDPHLVVITLDHDFYVYRRHGRGAVPLRMPRR